MKRKNDKERESTKEMKKIRPKAKNKKLSAVFLIANSYLKKKIMKRSNEI